MDRHRYVVAKGKVVGSVDRKEKHDTGYPYYQRYRPWFQEEGGMRQREVGRPGQEGSYQELGEGDKKALTALVMVAQA